MSHCVQGIWAISVAHTNPVIKPLYADAGSGIMFNLAGDVTIGAETLGQGVIMLPTNKRKEDIVLPSGSKLAGIRFLPAMGYGILRKHYDKPTLLLPKADKVYGLYTIYSRLQKKTDETGKIETLTHWAKQSFNFTHIIPDSLKKALEYIEQNALLGELSSNITPSQRQIERTFNLWLGMTPKYYQRLLRAKKLIYFLREHKKVCLATVAQQFGFSDQAHMTRELRTIGCITPGKIITDPAKAISDQHLTD